MEQEDKPKGPWDDLINGTLVEVIDNLGEESPYNPPKTEPEQIQSTTDQSAPSSLNELVDVAKRGLLGFWEEFSEKLRQRYGPDYLQRFNRNRIYMASHINTILRTKFA